MKRGFLCGAVLALCAGLAPSVGQTSSAPVEDARRWLERMLEAAQTLNYEGAFVYWHGPHVGSMRIIHGGDARGERQRLSSLSGPPREIVVVNGKIVCCLSADQQTAFEKNYHQHSLLPSSIPREPGRLESHYELQAVGEDRVAGLDAQVIVIKPRDRWRYGYRLWLDRRNAMALRSALLDEQDRPIEQMMFTDVQLKTQIDDAAFGAPPPQRAVPEVAAAGGGDAVPAGEPVTQSPWRVEQLPDGFTQVSHHRFTEISGRHPTEHLVFADGLATISVFLERLDQDPPLLQGGSQLGSMNAYGVVVEGHQVLVVGEVPAATVQRIATAIRYVAEGGKP